MVGITLDSFISQNYPKEMYEIIVVDNNSTDDTKSVIESYCDNNRNVEIKYLFEPRQGVHYARNSAAKHAKYEILYYTDDDMIAAPNLLSEIIKPFEFDNDVGTVTGRVLPKWETEPPSWIVKHCYNGLLSLHDPPEEFIISKRDFGVYSCHQAIRRDVFFESGGFNPENTAGIWIGDGETGLNIKIKALGYKFGYNGKSVIYHMIPKARMTQSYLNKRIGNQGFCDSYTEYRKYNPTSLGLVIRAFKRTFLKAPVRIANYLLNMILGKDCNYSRFALAYLYYFYKRLIYDYRLLTNNEWRKLVLRRDWLND